MERKIVGFELDEEGDWVARLDCCHRQHVRHHPPFINRPWVITDAGRDSMLGSALNCVRCDRQELPDHLSLLQRTELCSEKDMPDELRLGYLTKPGIWSRIQVLEGELLCVLQAPLARTWSLHALDTAIVPPEILHRVSPQGPVRFYVEYYVES